MLYVFVSNFSKLNSSKKLSLDSMSKTLAIFALSFLLSAWKDKYWCSFKEIPPTAIAVTAAAVFMIKLLCSKACR